MYKFIYNICLTFMAYKTKTQETKMEKRAKELQKFRSIFAALKRKLSLDEISQITGIHASNLSAYGSGAKNPSAATIGKFYIKLKAEIDNLSRPRKNTKSAKEQPLGVEEEQSIYEKTKRPKDTNSDLVRVLEVNNNRLWDNNNRLWDNNEKSSRRFDKIVDNNTKLVDNNTRLVDKVLSNHQMPWLTRAIPKKRKKRPK